MTARGIEKALAALIIAALQLITLFTGSAIEGSEEWILAISAVLAPIIVWMVPNR